MSEAGLSAAADLQSRRLVRSLCASVLQAEGGSRLQEEQLKRLLSELEDTAHSTLLGLHAVRGGPQGPGHAKGAPRSPRHAP